MPKMSSICSTVSIEYWLVMHGQMDIGHRTTAYTAIAQRRAVQMTYKSVICHGDYYDDDDDDDDEDGG